MRSGALAKRYARAIIELAAEINQVDRVGRDLKDAAGMWESSAGLREVFSNPSFGAQTRKKVLTDLAIRSAMSPTARNSLMYLADRRRLTHLPEIAGAFMTLAEQRSGKVKAEVISAAPLGESYYRQLQTALEQVTGKKVSIEKRTDPSMIGGVVTRVGDQVFDGSVTTQLHNLKDSLASL